MFQDFRPDTGKIQLSLICHYKLYVMKMNSFRPMIHKLALPLIVSTIVLVNIASAQPPVAATFRGEVAVIKCLGAYQETFIFNVAYGNIAGDKFMLRILDSTGTILFAGSYNEKKFNKVFQIGKEGTDRLSFVIRNLRDNAVQRFEITPTSKPVEDFVLRKINNIPLQ